MDQNNNNNEEETTVLISDQVTVNGTNTTVKLTVTGDITWVCGGGRRRRLTMEKEVIGFSVDGLKIKLRAVVEREGGLLFCRCCEGGAAADDTVRKCFVIEVGSKEAVRAWSRYLQDFIDSLGRPKRLFVFVNPYGGSKLAPKIFFDVVKPLLDDANIEYTLQETKYQLHAKEVALSTDLTRYDGIVCVSGDGTLVEVVNGLLERDDWRDAIKISLGVVPAGTGNGMAKSLLDAVGLPCSAFHATLAIIRGNKRALDVTTVVQGETKFFSVLMLAWGLIADIDIESEKYRWMGKIRLDVYAMQRMLHLRKYNGCISFVPAPGFEHFGEKRDHIGELIYRENRVHDREYLGPDIDLENCNWRKIEGPFISVWLHNVPWGSENTKAAPDAKFSDGYMDLILMRDCSKLSLLSLINKLGNGNHVKSPHISYLKVKAFILEPGVRKNEPTKEGIIDVDGEVLARGKGVYKAEKKSLMNYSKLQLTVDQGLATIFTPI